MRLPTKTPQSVKNTQIEILEGSVVRDCVPQGNGLTRNANYGKAHVVGTIETTSRLIRAEFFARSDELSYRVEKPKTVVRDKYMLIVLIWRVCSIWPLSISPLRTYFDTEVKHRSLVNDRPYL